MFSSFSIVDMFLMMPDTFLAKDSAQKLSLNVLIANSFKQHLLSTYHRQVDCIVLEI